MASKYSIIDYGPEDEREKDPQGPPLQNIFAAADYIACLLTANNVVHAFMGGFAMLCRGSQRSTQDIDVVTNASMKALWAITEPQPRLVIPNTKLLDGIITVFVKTGPSYDGEGCTQEREIEVDLVIYGAKGTPLSLADHIERVATHITGKSRTYAVLDIFTMIRSKLKNCASRALPRDLEDVEYLLNAAGPEVTAVADGIEDDDKEAFLTSDWVQQKSSAEQTKYRTILGC